MTPDAAAAALLAARRVRLPEALATTPADAGIYAWWSSEHGIGGIPGTPHGDVHLYYVGIADRAKSSLSQRMHDHIQKSTRKSTERTTLAALLFRDHEWPTKRVLLGPATTKSRTVLASVAAEAELSAWMHDHLRVSWIVLPQPNTVEHAVFSILRPPLNLTGNTTHAEYQRVKAARAAFNASAPIPKPVA